MATGERPPRTPTGTSPNWRLARLKTINPRRGIHMQRWSATWRGVHYELVHSQGWTWVPLSLANYLAEVPSRHGALPGGEGNEDHPRAFHVVECLADAKALDEGERRKNSAKVKAKPFLRINNSRGDLTTGDLARRRFDEIQEDGEEQHAGEQGEVVNEGELDDKIARLQEQLERAQGQKARSRDPKPPSEEPPAGKLTAVEVLEEEEDDEAGEAGAVAGGGEGGDDENPDLNVSAKAGPVDFRAEGDRPKKAAKKNAPARPPAQRQQERGGRSMRPG